MRVARSKQRLGAVWELIGSNDAHKEPHGCGSALAPGDRVLVVSAPAAAISHIASPDVLPAALRSRLPTLIADAATTGNSGSRVTLIGGVCLASSVKRSSRVRNNAI